jgi:hypothetical protein
MAGGYPAGTPVLNMVTVAQNPATVQGSDGAPQNLTGGHQGELFTRQLGGKRYTAAARGNLYIASQTATLNVYTSTAATVVLWNPPQSGRFAELHQVGLTQILATDVVDGIVLGYSTVAPSANTPVTPARMPLGGQSLSNAAIATSAATVTAPSLLRGLGVSSLVTTGLASITGQIVDLDGTVVLGPGSLIVVGTSTTVEGGANFVVDLVWSEWLP